MQKCLNCSHEQEMGKFCAKCGSPIQSVENTSTDAKSTLGYDDNSEVAATEAYTQHEQLNKPNQNVEQVKQTAKNYMNSFIDLIKNPTSASSKDTLFANGIISFVLLSLLLGLATTEIINKFFASILGLFGSFINYTDERVLSLKYLFLFSIVFALLSLVTILTVFFANKLFVQARSFKSVFVNITNFYPLVIIVTLLTYLIALLDLPKVAVFLLVLALTIVLTLAPLFVMSRDMENKTTKFDKFYIYILVSLAITIISYFVTDISLSNIIESYTPNYDEYYDEMW